MIINSVKSPTGIVHAIKDTKYKHFYRSLCNYSRKTPLSMKKDNRYHRWELSTEQVTCKKCLMQLFILTYFNSTDKNEKN